MGSAAAGMRIMWHPNEADRHLPVRVIRLSSLPHRCRSELGCPRGCVPAEPGAGMPRAESEIECSWLR